MPPYYEITLTLPTSVNAAHAVSRGHKDKKTKKWTRVKIRSAEYTEWLDTAGREYRRQFPCGIGNRFTGRLRVDYIFIWNKGSRSTPLSDVSNREKVLSDFLESKFFDNDNQIDEQHHYRRIVTEGINRVIVRIYEISDRRYDDPALIFNPVKAETLITA